MNSQDLSQLSMWSNLRKWKTQTHFKHTHAFFQQRSSDDKTFPHCLHMKFSDLLSALMDVAMELVSTVCRKCFQGFMHSVFGLWPLVNVPLATNTLTCDLWKWAMEETQRDKSNAPNLCNVFHFVCVREKVKEKKTNKKRHRGKVCKIDGVFPLLMLQQSLEGAVNPHAHGTRTRVGQRYYL